ncbi:MAG TPA: ABC transporter permease subunit [Acidimicrobiales bacterium]|jgi:putative spermidine/putrescine transport system permease protein|nr:ABC transporter permease subunit [Acidimicrobiales bacterium]
MVALGLAEFAADLETVDGHPARPTRMDRLRRVAWWRGIVLILTGVFFLVPIYAALHFALSTVEGGFSISAFQSIPHQQGFSDAFGLSLRLAIMTTLITMVLMVPTSVFVHLRFPGLRRLFDGITIIPIVIPPVVLIVGVLQVAPTFLKGTPYLLGLEYAVLAMPFVYRSLDAGLRSIDLTTLVEASRSLGSRWSSTLLRVVVPNLRTALLSATVLTVALVLGEYTMASLDQYQTVPVWIVAFDQDNAHISVAVSLVALVGTWVVLLAISSFDLRRIRRASQLRKDGSA